MKTCLFFCLTLFWAALTVQAIDPKTLEIGAKAPDFKLMGTDGKTYSLARFSKSKVLVVVFTCNHCPTAQAYEDRIIRLTNDYKAKGVQVVAISTNDPSAVRLDELGYTDLSDTFEEMKIRYKAKKYNFPYLYDETQEVAQAYRAACTPDFFVFDAHRKLAYRGQLDDSRPKNGLPVTGEDLRNALDLILSGQSAPAEQRPSIGCNIKWHAGKEPSYFNPSGVQ